jgi:23S rRNA (cytidine1920-2'-O)/16S rRNA (cytidine1409-2'-O)-methyltransferase
VSIENTDIRALDAARLSEPPDFVVIDVSFISLRLVLPAALAISRAPAQLVVLIKPQYEVGRRRFKNGIVRDPKIHAALCAETTAWMNALGWNVIGVIASPVLGGGGNREFLLGARRD